MASDLNDIELDGFISSDTTSMTSQIIEDARKAHSSKKKRNATIFFKLVMGGANSVVSEVLEELKNSSRDKDLYKWLTCFGKSSATVKIRTQACNYCIKLLKYLLLVPLWVIFTPFFYGIHRLINSILNSKEMVSRFALSEYERLDFPLVFAVFSADFDTVKLFLDHEVPIDLEDNNGNNVAHYLADLSAYDLPRATKCYELLCNMADSGQISKDTLHKIITSKENLNMQNAIEYSCQFGSLKLACRMINDALTTPTMSIVGNTVVMATNNDKCLSSQKTIVQTKSLDNAFSRFPSQKELSKLNNNDEGDGREPDGWTLKRMVITAYTAYHRHGFVSHLLHLLNARDTTSISQENWASFQKHSGMQKWMKLKFKQWLWPIGITLVLEWIVTLILVLGEALNKLIVIYFNLTFVFLLYSYLSGQFV